MEEADGEEPHGGIFYWSLCLIALCVAVYLTWKLLSGAIFYFREYYVLWHIATGGRSDKRRMSTKIRLHVYVCKTELLDAVSVNELYGFLINMMDSDVSIREFHSVLLSYKFAIICRERKDGSLRGVTLMSIDKKEHNGVGYTLIRLGLSFFQNFYRGGPLLYFVLTYHAFKEMLLHPLTPLYVIGKSFSYKSYVAMCHNLSHAYPRYDKETPDFEHELINEYGLSVKSSREVYNAETFVLERERTAIKESVAPLSKESLNEPHIKFFVERNPGWMKGHQLIVLSAVKWSDVVRVIWRAVTRARRARGKSEDKRPEDKNQFQSEDSNRYITVYSEVDMGGDSRTGHTQWRRNPKRLDSYDVYNYS